MAATFRFFDFTYSLASAAFRCSISGCSRLRQAASTLEGLRFISPLSQHYISYSRDYYRIIPPPRVASRDA
jgi:hypothetical protein